MYDISKEIEGIVSIVSAELDSVKSKIKNAESRLNNSVKEHSLLDKKTREKMKKQKEIDEMIESIESEHKNHEEATDDDNM